MANISNAGKRETNSSIRKSNFDNRLFFQPVDFFNQSIFSTSRFFNQSIFSTSRFAGHDDTFKSSEVFDDFNQFQSAAASTSERHLSITIGPASKSDAHPAAIA